jgi:hypothetical protein
MGYLVWEKRDIPIKTEKRKRSGWQSDCVRSDFTFVIPYSVPNSILSDNTKRSGENVENGTERIGMYPVRFQP